MSVEPCAVNMLAWPVSRLPSRSLGEGWCYCGGGDGDGAGVSCRDRSGVAVGKELEGSGDAPGGGFSFNEDGACINESKESLAGVGDNVGVGEVAFSCAGVGGGSFGVPSM